MSIDSKAPSPRTDLPLQPKAIIGREQDLAVARQRLLLGDVRLLTLTGPPGVGKTRLALELANDVRDAFADGVRFVDLAPITDPRLVIDAIARALGLKDVDRRVALEVVDEFLRVRSILLVLDNFEQVLDAAEIVSRLLATSPGLKVLATSRAPLHLRWERELAVPTLQLPALETNAGAESVVASPAGRLFVERAQAVAPDFRLGDGDAAAVAEICARLDGLPLAIELAAARSKLFPPRALLRRLTRSEPANLARESPLRLLVDPARDLPARQQTLLHAISWSYDLLTDDEQAVFRRLSVFVGGCSLEAAEAVCAAEMPNGLDVVASLVDKSLVWREEQSDGEPRLRMLETIREYAAEQLAASGDADSVLELYAAYFLGLVEEAARDLAGPRMLEWFGRLDRERDNLRAAERSAAAGGDTTTILRLAGALWPFWLARDNVSQSRDRLDTLLPRLDRAEPDLVLARALHAAGLMAEKLGDYATCRALLERSLALARQLANAATISMVLDSLGRQEFLEGHYARSRELLEESVAMLGDSTDQAALARVLSHLGFLEYLEQRPAAARPIFERGLALARAVEDRHRVAEFLDNLGNTAAAEERLDDAARMFQEAVRIWRELGQGPHLAMVLNNLGKLETRRGQHAASRALLREALVLAHRMGNRRRMAYTLAAIGTLALAEGHTERAARLQAASTATIAEVGATPRQSFPTRPAPVPTDRAEPLPLSQAVEEALAWLDAPATPAGVASTPLAVAAADSLTRRERDVVALLALAQSNRQIAETLVLSEGTVENYVQRILGKLGFNNRAQIALWAVEQGLGRMRPD